MLIKIIRYFCIFTFLLFISCKSTQELRDHDSVETELQNLVLPLLGTSYSYGGSSPSQGFDCSGFSAYIYQEMGYALPRRSSDQAKLGNKIALDEISEGDLLFFKLKGKVDHVAIVVSFEREKLMIAHSTSSKGVILEDYFNSSYWKSRFFQARRIINP